MVASPSPRAPRSTTTMIPLKGLESSPAPPAKRRGRPRKSDVDPSKRTGTPTTSRAGRRKTAGDASDGTSVVPARSAKTPRKPRARPRKSSIAPAEPTEADAVQTEQTSPEKSVSQGRNRSASTASTAAKRGKGRRKAMSPVRIAIDSSEIDGPGMSEADPPATLRSGPLSELSHNPSLRTSSSITSSGTKPSEAPALENESQPRLPADALSDQMLSPPPLRSTTALDDQAETATQQFASSEVDLIGLKPTRSDLPVSTMATTESNGNAVAGLGLSEVEQLQALEHDEGPCYDLASDSVLESEGFSMVSIDSIPSAREHLSSPSLPHRCNDGQPVLSAATTSKRDTTGPSLAHGDFSIEVPDPLCTQNPVVRSVADGGFSKHEQDQHGYSPADLGAHSSPAKSPALDTRHVTLITPDETPSPRRGAVHPDNLARHAMDDTRLTAGDNTNLFTDGDISFSGVMHSSPPIHNIEQSNDMDASQWQRTPSMIHSSPSLPPPIAPCQPRPEKSSVMAPERKVAGPADTTPKSIRVMRAGQLLQGAIGMAKQLGSPFRSPARKEEIPPSSDDVHHDGLFGGFGQETRRELQEGLKLGQQLALQQAAASTGKQQASSPSKANDDVFSDRQVRRKQTLAQFTSTVKPGYALNVPDSRQIRYPELSAVPSPSADSSMDDDAMSWRVDTPVKKFSPPIQAVRISGKGSSERRRMERRQGEGPATQPTGNQENRRENVDERGDVWQSEAASPSPVGSGRELHHRPDVMAPAGAVSKPPRSKIPSPWRRDGQIIYSDEIQDDDDDDDGTSRREEVAADSRIGYGEDRWELSEDNDDLFSSDDRDSYSDDGLEDIQDGPQAEQSRLDLTELFGLNCPSRQMSSPRLVESTSQVLSVPSSETQAGPSPAHTLKSFTTKVPLNDISQNSPRESSPATGQLLDGPPTPASEEPVATTRAPPPRFPLRAPHRDPLPILSPSAPTAPSLGEFSSIDGHTDHTLPSRDSSATEAGDTTVASDDPSRSLDEQHPLRALPNGDFSNAHYSYLSLLYLSTTPSSRCRLRRRDATFPRILTVYDDVCMARSSRADPSLPPLPPLQLRQPGDIPRDAAVWSMKDIYIQGEQTRLRMGVAEIDTMYWFMRAVRQGNEGKDVFPMREVAIRIYTLQDAKEFRARGEREREEREKVNGKEWKGNNTEEKKNEGWGSWLMGKVWA
ncbi:MAG: hypothetical protein M1817_001909 [Caeruleum heppii]|nr:MAG: hypothetical protein M1817_001909 [Caeruleum heppii]